MVDYLQSTPPESGAVVLRTLKRKRQMGLSYSGHVLECGSALPLSSTTERKNLVFTVIVLSR
jgi:hypothetical protein